MTATLGLIGVPTSAGAFAPGQERAPRALRAAGLVDALRGGGIEVRDHGDRAEWRWRPDRDRPRAQNLERVVEVVGDTARRVAEAASRGERTLVLGGDCTVGIGTVAGHASTGERVALVYFDTHADLNVPASVREGALDWMGMAHMLGRPGAAPELASVGGTTPLLDADQVVLFAWGPEQATPHELEEVSRLGIDTIPVDEVAAEPAAAAARAVSMAESRGDRLLVHLDVDVVDFTDMPLSENTGRNAGLAFDAACRALDELLASPRLAGVTVTELNPDHAEPGGVERFAEALAASLSCAPGLAVR